MAKVSPEVLAIIREALERYAHEVQESQLADNTQTTYLLHSNNFVRWLNDDFEPGARVR